MLFIDSGVAVSTNTCFLSLKHCILYIQFFFIFSGDQVSSSNSKDQDYVSGMHTCANEVMNFLTTASFGNNDPDVKVKLLDHLANRLTCPSSPTSSDNASVKSHDAGSTPTSPSYASTEAMVTSTETTSREDNNNSPIRVENKSSYLDSNQLSPPVSPMSQSTSPLKPIHTNQHIQPLFQMPQSLNTSTAMPTVPVTILVPANFYSTNMAPQCIPFSGHGSQMITQSDNTASTSPSPAMPVLRTSSPQSSPTSTMSPVHNQTLSPEGAPYFVQILNGQVLCVSQTPFKHDTQQQSSPPTPTTCNSLQTIAQPIGLLRKTVPCATETDSSSVNYRQCSPKEVDNINVTRKVLKPRHINTHADNVQQNNEVICDNAGPVWRPW